MDFNVPAQLKDVSAATDKLIIEILDHQEQTKGGIILHSYSKPALTKGVVMHVGPSNNTTLEQGQIVLFDKVLALEARINAKTYWVLNQSDINAIIGHTDGLGKVEYYGNSIIR